MRRTFCPNPISMAFWSAGPALRRRALPRSSGRWPAATVLLPPDQHDRLAVIGACVKELVLTVLYVVIEIIAAFSLVFLILMHSGKGGGLSDMFGGSVGAAAQGSTVVERNLDRITVTVAVIFALTSLTLDLRLQ